MRELLLVPGLLGAAVLYAAWDAEAGIRPWWHLHSELAATTARMEEARRDIERLRREVAELESEPFAIERAIREDLGWTRPGELRVELPARGSNPRYP